MSLVEWWLRKGESFGTPIQREVRVAGTLAQRRNEPGGASYTELGDWETHLLWWRFLNPWMIDVTQGLLRYINHHPMTDVHRRIFSK